MKDSQILMKFRKFPPTDNTIQLTIGAQPPPPPVFQGVKHAPLFLQHTDPLIQPVPTPVAIIV